jgi:predicted DNA-binding transcriptional regulator AlpA
MTEMNAQELKQAIAKALERLTYRERIFLGLYFGLEDGRAHDYAEIGKVFHIGRERARQIVERGLKRMSRFQETWSLYQFLEPDKGEEYIVPKNYIKQLRHFKLDSIKGNLDIEGVANTMNVSTHTIRQWMKRGKFPKPDVIAEGKKQYPVQGWSRILIRAWLKLNPNTKRYRRQQKQYTTSVD